MRRLLHRFRIPFIACLVFSCTPKPPPIVAASVRATRPDGTVSRVRATSPGAYQHYLAGTIAYEEGRYSDALDEFLEAFSYDSQDPYLSIRVAELLWRAGDLEQAEELCREAIKIDPSLPESHLLLGKLLETQGNFSGAKSAYRRTIRLTPKKPQSYLQLGALYLSQGDQENAEEVFSLMREKIPSAAIDGYIYLAKDALAKKEETRAIHFLTEIFLRDPSQVEAVASLGRILSTRSQTEKAIQIYRESLEASGDDLRLLLPLFLLLLDHGKPEEISLYSEKLFSLAVEKNSPQTLESMGKAYLKIQEPHEALLPLNQAVKLAPTRKEPHFLLGLVYKRLGEMTRSLEELERASVLDPEDTQVLFHLGDVFAQTGQVAKAKELYLRLLTNRPHEPFQSAIQEQLKKLPNTP